MSTPTARVAARDLVDRRASGDLSVASAVAARLFSSIATTMAGIDCTAAAKV
jgi:hypothetical protein